MKSATDKVTESPIENPTDNRFQCRDGGLWFDSGNGEPRRLSDAFTVAGSAYDKSGDPHYIIEHQRRYFALAWEDLGERNAWKTLRRHIRRLPTSAQDKGRIVDYLQTQPLNAQWRLTDTAGWHGNAYVLPNGEILGDNENVLFQHATKQDGAYLPKGTLNQWQRDVGQYLAGNSRLCLFTGAAFAAPLLQWFNLEGGILHIYGQSSSGKSTAQRVALSVWGHGKDAGHSWNATGYALTNAAASRNDGLLSLDEIGEDSKQAVESCAYTLANGRGRLQGAKDGGNRPEVRFRVLAVSSGETTLKAHFNKGGREIMAGQMVRCPSILHKLESSHGFDSFKSFADHLNNAVISSYGHAGRAFIEKLMTDTEKSQKRVKTLYEAFLGELHSLHTMTAQASRTARLFAVSAAGLMLASEWGITGISAEQAKQGIKTCFADWHAEQPQGDIEDTALREKVVAKMPQLIGLFVPLNQAKNPTSYPKDYVGFVDNDTAERIDIYDMLTSRFDELFDCKDNDKRKRAYRILGEDMRWLLRDEKRKTWKQRRRINGELWEVYRFHGLTPPPEPFVDDED